MFTYICGSIEVEKWAKKVEHRTKGLKALVPLK